MMEVKRASRNFSLAAHMAFSVGWFGAVASFLALALVGLTNEDTQIVKACFIAMEIISWFVILPACLASFITGLIQSLGTQWGLFKHYWIIVKLFLTIGSTILLLLHLQPISYLAGIAKDPAFIDYQYSKQLIDLITKAIAAILVLLTIITISVYKPWGKAKLQVHHTKYLTVEADNLPSKKSWPLLVIILLIVLAIVSILMHLFGGITKH